MNRTHRKWKTACDYLIGWSLVTWLPSNRQQPEENVLDFKHKWNWYCELRQNGVRTCQSVFTSMVHKQSSGANLLVPMTWSISVWFISLFDIFPAIWFSSLNVHSSIASISLKQSKHKCTKLLSLIFIKLFSFFFFLNWLIWFLSVHFCSRYLKAPIFVTGFFTDKFINAFETFVFNVRIRMKAQP